MKLSLYSGNLSTYYKSITLVEGKNSCTSLIMNGLYQKLWFYYAHFGKINQQSKDEYKSPPFRPKYGPN